MERSPHTTARRTLPFRGWWLTCLVLFLARPAGGQVQGLVTGDLFPLQHEHVHSSTLVELPGGDLLCAWFAGSGERKANDVRIMGCRKKPGQPWSLPFLMADTPGLPDCNPVLFLDRKKKLWLFWIVVRANRWEASLLKYRTSTQYAGKGAPRWEWQDEVLLQPGDTFATTIHARFRSMELPELAWSEYAPSYEEMIYRAALDPVKRSMGWMTRTLPLQLPSGRILLPLYSDGYNLSLIARSDDDGTSWQASLPIVGRGNVQPALVRKKDGTLMAWMRDNGDAPGRIMTSTSHDDGITWTAARKSDLPNPGSSVAVIALRNGHWVMVYNDTEKGRHRLAVSLSTDEGESWPFTRHIENDPGGEDSYSYPTVIQTRDGMIHVSYSCSRGVFGETIRHALFDESWILGDEHP